MNMTLVKTVGAKATKVAARTGLKLRKISPELMLAGSIAAGVGAVVTACVATKKLVKENVMEEAHAELDAIQMLPEDIQDKKTRKQKILKVCWRLVKKLIRIYGPTVVLLLLSGGLALGSHGILKKRYVSATLAYKGLDEAFKDYRRRIAEAVGEEKEKYFFYGTEEGGETTIIQENGESVTTKDIVKVHPKKNSPYEFDFNAKTAPGNWESNMDYNLMFLKSIQNYANDLLNSRGHVFLNEILDGIGLPRIPEGQAIGWLKGCGGDDFVDFGIFEYDTDEYSDVYSDAQNGYLKNIHLNFNADGIIWNKI